MALFYTFIIEMADIIHLLPDLVANQIAAGEVVQRPASVVKELLENTIDSGATEVKLIIKESGKMLIQVTDNGCGMSERDARMCFERHATSKIQKSDDLLQIRTLGFRGEALASIASIAHVELKTKRLDDEIGTSVQVEGTVFKEQSPVNCQNGSSISVKNLFYNVPARRNFLKSNTLELKYIIEEFFRVALVNPHVSFTFYNHDKTQFKVPPGNLKQRIVNLFGTSYNQRLIPVEQHTDLVNISGFIGKPEFAKKTRGEQYFFTNGRFMKSPYLHHAIEGAFKELIPHDSLPSYFIYMEVDPQTIDVNIHPTKTEINFQDTKSIYAILHAAVKQSIGKFNISPTIDFDVENSLNLTPLAPNQQIEQPVIKVNPDYNPFEKKTEPQSKFSFSQSSRQDVRGWNDFYANSQKNNQENLPIQHSTDFPEQSFGAEVANANQFRKISIQIQQSFILTYTKTGVIVIDQQHAHERILYENFSETQQNSESTGQHQLFPQTVNLSPDNAAFYLEWKDYFTEIGFDINDFGNGSFVIHAFPFHISPSDPVGFFESVLEGLKSPGGENKLNQRQILAKTLAKKLAVKRGRSLQHEEIEALIENLFACKVPELSPDGKPTMVIMSFDDLYKKFKIY
ncbi:MAG: DNA mismatch repair endonuclease MutL [Bacteroidetes bacterium]|nr:DNA mismatch repair endonuclease MutL [Bacteroidota bacterium]